MSALSFTVPGAPRGKGRPRFFRRGPGIGTFTDDKTAAYENLVALAASQAHAGAEPLDGCNQAGVWADDSRVVVLTAHKVYGEPCAKVAIVTMDAAS